MDEKPLFHQNVNWGSSAWGGRQSSPNSHSGESSADEEIEEDIEDEIMDEIEEQVSAADAEKDRHSPSLKEQEDNEAAIGEVRQDEYSGAYDYSSDMEAYSSTHSSSKMSKKTASSGNEKPPSDKKLVDHENAELKEALEKERKARAALEEALEKMTAKSVQEAQEKERIAKVEMENMKAQMATLTKSLKKEQCSNAKLNCRVNEMAVELKEDRNLIKKLKEDLATSSCRHKRDREEHDKKALAKIQALKDSLIQQQEESLEKVSEIESLQVKIQNLQRDNEDMDNLLTSLKQKAKQWASDLQEEQKKNCRLQRDAEAALSEQQRGAEDLDRLARENLSRVKDFQELTSAMEAEKALCAKLQDTLEKEAKHGKDLCLQIEALQEENRTKDVLLASKDQRAKQPASEISEEQMRNKKLQGDLEAALTERQFSQKQLEESRAACSKLEEALMKETARLKRVCKKVKLKDKELSEKTLAIEKSLTTERLLSSSLKEEKMRSEQMAVENQTKVKDLINLSNQLSESLRSVSSQKERLICDMQTLKMENDDNRVKHRVMEIEHENLLSKYNFASDLHKEQISNKNYIISEHEGAINKLQAMVDQLQASLLESKTRQTELEDALKQEQKRSSKFQQKAHKIASSLKEEKATSEKYRVELKEALSKQIKTLEEHGQLTVALRQAQETYSMFQGQQAKHATEMEIQSRHVHDTELKFCMQNIALDQKTKDLYQLQMEYQDLGKRHKDINIDYCQLLKDHSALQVRHERLSYAQGKPRPEFSPPHFTACN